MDLDGLRLIDANANRAREGLRTAEDYLRFALGESRRSRTLKSLRAGITRSVQQICDDRTLLSSRKSGIDPQRPSNEYAEREPTPVSESHKMVARRGLKRAQEALRVLEEYLRGEFPLISQGLSQMRYQAYDCEQWLECSSDAMRIIAESKVYVLLTEKLCKQGLLSTAKAVLRGGARIMQLREKEGTSATDVKMLQTALDLRKLCTDNGAIFICNDRVDFALASESHGVHVGQQDLPPEAIRRVAGQRLIVGCSTHTVEQARSALNGTCVDYIAIGAMYETTTKQGRILTGIKLAEDVAALGIEIPIFAIGGIKLENIRELKNAGVQRVAISSAIISAENVEDTTRRFVEEM